MKDLADLGLELHREKTKVVDLSAGREGPHRAMNRVRAKIEARTGRGRAGQDICHSIAPATTDAQFGL